MPTRAHTRRDPQKGKIGFSKAKAFTVIELMIALAVVAIIASLAMPSYRAIIEKRQVTKGAEQLAAFLSVAKGQAVKLNEDIAISYTHSGGNWCVGYRTGQDYCDCTETVSTEGDFCGIDYDRDGSITVDEKRVFSDADFSHAETLAGITFFNGGTALPSNKVMVYDSVRGMLEVTADTADALSLAMVSHPDGEYALNVEIDRLGRVTLCSPASGGHKAVPGYDSCAP